MADTDITISVDTQITGGADTTLQAVADAASTAADNTDKLTSSLKDTSSAVASVGSSSESAFTSVSNVGSALQGVASNSEGITGISAGFGQVASMSGQAATGISDVTQKLGEQKAATDDLTKSVEGLTTAETAENNAASGGGSSGGMSMEDRVKRRLATRQAMASALGNYDTQLGMQSARAQMSGAAQNPFLKAQVMMNSLSGENGGGAQFQAIKSLGSGAISMATEGLNGLSKAINILGDSSKSDSEKTQALAESLPIVGGLVKSWDDFMSALEGTPDKLRQLAKNFQSSMMDMTAQASINKEQHKLEMEQYDPSVKALAFGAIGKADYGEPPDVSDQKAYAEWQKTLPGISRQNLVERNLWAAQKKAQYLTNKPDSMTSKLNQDRMEVKDSQKAWEKASDPKAEGKPEEIKVAKVKAAQSLIKDATAESTDLETSINAIMEKRAALVDLAQKEHDIRQSGIDTEKQVLALLTQQEQKISQAYSSFAQLDEGSRLMATQAAAQLNESGIDSLSEDQKALIRQAGGGDYLQKAQVAAIADDENLAAFRQAIGETQTLADVQQQKATVQNNILIESTIDEQKLADALNAAAQKDAENLLKKITAKINSDNLVKAMQQELQKANAGGS
jgi:hypothetical protein